MRRRRGSPASCRGSLEWCARHRTRGARGHAARVRLRRRKRQRLLSNRRPGQADGRARPSRGAPGRPPATGKSAPAPYTNLIRGSARSETHRARIMAPWPPASRARSSSGEGPSSNRSALAVRSRIERRADRRPRRRRGRGRQDALRRRSDPHPADGARVLAGGCVDVAGGTVPFAPMIEALRGLVRRTPEPELDRPAGPRSGGPGRPASAAARVRAMPTPGPASPTAPPRADSSRLSSALLERLSGEPTVLVVEDIHWADRRRSTCSHSRPEPARRGRSCCGHVPKRRSAPASSAGALPGRAEPQPARSRASTSPASTAAKSRPSWRRSAGRQPDVELVDRIYSRSEGNPFFAEELLAAGGSRAGADPGHASRGPRRPNCARWASRASSCCGSPRRPGRASGRACWAPSSAWTTETLLTSRSGRRSSTRSCCPRTMAGRASTGSGTRSCARPSTPTCCPPSERGSTRASPTCSKAMPEADRDASIAAEIAYHRYAAHDLARALEASVRAGIAAESAWAFAEAQVQFERALELWDQVPDAAQRTGFDRVDLLARAAAAASKGDASRAVATCIREAIGLVDPGRGSGACRASVFAACRITTGSSATAGRALDAGREAVRLVPSSPPSVARARVTAALGQILMVEGFMADSLPICEEAVAVARAVGAREVEGHALNSLGTDLGYLGDLPAGLAKLEEARDIAREVGNVEDVARAWANIVDLQNMAGLYERGRETRPRGVGLRREPWPRPVLRRDRLVRRCARAVSAGSLDRGRCRRSRGSTDTSFQGTRSCSSTSDGPRSRSGAVEFDAAQRAARAARQRSSRTPSTRSGPRRSPNSMPSSASGRTSRAARRARSKRAWRCSRGGRSSSPARSRGSGRSTVWGCAPRPISPRWRARTATAARSGSTSSAAAATSRRCGPCATEIRQRLPSMVALGDAYGALCEAEASAPRRDGPTPRPGRSQRTSSSAWACARCGRTRSGGRRTTS